MDTKEAYLGFFDLKIVAFVVDSKPEIIKRYLWLKVKEMESV